MSTSTRTIDDSALYRPPTESVFVDVPAFGFATIDGHGDPSTSQDYQDAVAALYAYSYPVVIAMNKVGGPKRKVGPLEGLWWADDLAVFDPTQGDRSKWRWQMLIRQPDDVSIEVQKSALTKVAKKVGNQVAGRLRFERFDEGRCAQLMHVGPYADEGPSISRLHAFVAANGSRLRGRHHEIYLTDPHKTAPDKMRTVLRQPVEA